MATHLLHSDLSSVQTTNATVTTVLTYAHPDNSVVRVRLQTIGWKAATGDSVTYLYEISTKRVATAAPTTVGAAHATFVDEDAAINACASDVSVSGNNLIARVTGIAATTIDWMCQWEIMVLTA